MQKARFFYDNPYFMVSSARQIRYFIITVACFGSATRGFALKIRNYLEYLPFISCAAVVRVLPRPLALRLGRAIGSLGRLLQPRRVRIARENLQQAFPEMSEAELAATLKQIFHHLGASFVDLLRLDLFASRKDLDRYFTFEGIEHLHETLALGRGGILLSGHVGFWEAGAFFLPQFGIKAGFVAKPMRNPLVDAYLTRMRTASGCYLINSRKGARRIVKALQSNHLVGILMDQHTRPRDSLKIPFFGRPAYTTPVVAQIAMKQQAPVLPSFVYRQADGSYTVRFEPMILLDPGSMSVDDVRRNTILLTECIERGIQREVSQWFWVHRRWRTPPEESALHAKDNSKPSAGQTDAH